MSRKTLVTVHLYLAAFFTPMVIMMAISGGLYLFGIKGQMNYQTLAHVTAPDWSDDSAQRTQQVRQLLQAQHLASDFEYLKIKGDTWYTRPTSREHFRLQQHGDQLRIDQAQPNLQAMMIELHKGHGPGWFKWFEKAFALGLLLVMVSGFIMGLQSPLLKKQTLVLGASGLIIIVLLALA